MMTIFCLSVFVLCSSSIDDTFLTAKTMSFCDMVSAVKSFV
jgi:hypothetical protein